MSITKALGAAAVAGTWRYFTHPERGPQRRARWSDRLRATTGRRGPVDEPRGGALAHPAGETR